jgi:ATP-dependent RNA helicase RhlE
MAIHGNKSQSAREKALDGFRDGSTRVLVATDIAARGIDVPGITHVINFDLPNVSEQYVHRIGRTARAGREGVSLSFCAPDEREFLRDIEKLTRQRVTVVDEHPVASTPAHVPAATPHPRVHRPRAPHPRHAPRRPHHAGNGTGHRVGHGSVGHGSVGHGSVGHGSVGHGSGGHRGGGHAHTGGGHRHRRDR